MKHEIIGSNRDYATVNSDDFLGSTHALVELKTDTNHIAILPKRFAWNTFTLMPEVGAYVSVFLTISSPEEIAADLAHWIPLEDFQNVTKPAWYMWEHPIVAYGLRGVGKVHFDIASKQE